jgi:hypothetical protein
VHCGKRRQYARVRADCHGTKQAESGA